MFITVGIDNCHVRGQRIVGQRVFLSGGVVGYDGKRRDFEPVPDVVVMAIIFAFTPIFGNL